MSKIFQQYKKEKDIFINYLPTDIMVLVDKASVPEEIKHSSVKTFLESEASGTRDTEQLINVFIEKVPDQDLKRFYNITYSLYKQYEDSFANYVQFMNVCHFIPVYKQALITCKPKLEGEGNYDDKMKSFDDCIHNVLSGYCEKLVPSVVEVLKKSIQSSSEKTDKIEEVKAESNKPDSTEAKIPDSTVKKNTEVSNKSDNWLRRTFKDNTVKFVLILAILIFIALVLWKDKLKFIKIKSQEE